MLGLDIAVACVERLDLERLTRLDPQERFIAPVESELAGQVSRNALHGSRDRITRGQLIFAATRKATRSRKSWSVIDLGQVIGHDRSRLRLAFGNLVGLDRDQPALCVGEDERSLRATVRARCR